VSPQTIKNKAWTSTSVIQFLDRAQFLKIRSKTYRRWKP